jgi:hypothetical protein
MLISVYWGGTGDAGEGQHRGLPSIYPETLPEPAPQSLLSTGEKNYNHNES